MYEFQGSGYLPFFLSDSSEFLVNLISLLLHEVRVAVVVRSLPFYLSQLVFDPLTFGSGSLQLRVLLLESCHRAVQLGHLKSIHDYNIYIISVENY